MSETAGSLVELEAEGEAIGGFVTEIDDLGDKLKARREETARMDLTAKMIPIMVETIDKFSAMGATPEHIARFLQAPIDEINTGSR